jgi:hypothetical protein
LVDAVKDFPVPLRLVFQPAKVWVELEGVGLLGKLFVPSAVSGYLRVLT